MSDQSAIEWTDATWNPLRARVKGGAPRSHGDTENGRAGERQRPGWACEKVSPGCANCYAERMNKRLGTGRPFTPAGARGLEQYLDEDVLREPLRWKKPRRVFVCSMTDLFGHWVPDATIDRIFAVMALAPQHTFQVLTKRAERMAGYFGAGTDNREEAIGAQALKISKGAHSGLLELPLPNIWLGVSVEDQPRADERIPHLLRCPAAVRFLSVEPLLGPVDLSRCENKDGWRCDPMRVIEMERPTDHSGVAGPISWVIVGGESGPGARPMHPDWVRSIRDQCVGAGVPFFFKQWGEWAPDCKCGGPVSCKTVRRPEPGPMGVVYRCGKKRAGRLLDDMEWNQYPVTYKGVLVANDREGRG